MSPTHSHPADVVDKDEVAVKTWKLQPIGFYAGTAAQMRSRGQTAKHRAEAMDRLMPALREQQRLQLAFVDLCQKLSALDAERCEASDRSIFDVTTEAWLSRAQSLLHKTEAKRFALPDDLSHELLLEGKLVVRQFATYVRNIDAQKIQGKKRKPNKRQPEVITVGELPDALQNEVLLASGEETEILAETFDVYIPPADDAANEHSLSPKNEAHSKQVDKDDVLSEPFHVYAPRANDVYGLAHDITTSEPKKAGYSDYIDTSASNEERCLDKSEQIKLLTRIAQFPHPLTLVRAGEWKNLRRRWPHVAEDWTIEELWFDPEDGPAALAIPQGEAPKLVRYSKRTFVGEKEAVIDAIETPTLDAKFLDDPKYIDKKSLSFVTITGPSDIRDEAGLRFFTKRCQELPGEAIICSREELNSRHNDIIISNRFRGNITQEISEIYGFKHICIVNANTYDYSIINKLKDVFTLTLIGSHAHYHEERVPGLDRNYRWLSAFDWGALLGAGRFLIES